MEKAKLQFGLKGLSVMIVFGNKKESDIYECKADILGELPGMVSAKKLTQEEAIGLATEVMKSETLPGTARQEDRHANIMGMIMESLSGPGFESMEEIGTIFHAKKIFGDVIQAMRENSESEFKPLFRVCSCGSHGMFLWGKMPGGIATSTGSIHTKTEARKVIEGYKKAASLEEEDEKNLLHQIDSCSLPETVSQEKEETATAN